MTGTATALNLARAQFAFTVSFHFIFPAFSIGLASYLAVLEALWLKIGKSVYDNLYRYWIKIFAIVFGMGGVKLLLEGFACRYKTLEDGRRQIVAHFVPGDLCDLRVFILKRMDHSIGAIAPSTVATLAPDNVLKLMHNYPALTGALWWSTLVEEAIAREWIVNVGQRTALERMAHLFCELLYRFRAVGLNQGLSCTLPLTQVELAETLGLSSVHVNRTLQELRRQKLITLDSGTLTIQNLKALEELSFFNSDYLHQDYKGDKPKDVEREAV